MNSQHCLCSTGNNVFANKIYSMRNRSIYIWPFAWKSMKFFFTRIFWKLPFQLCITITKHKPPYHRKATYQCAVHAKKFFYTMERWHSMLLVCIFSVLHYMTRHATVVKHCTCINLCEPDTPDAMNGIFWSIWAFLAAFLPKWTFFRYNSDFNRLNEWQFSL